jgi:hypothetical protein
VVGNIEEDLADAAGDKTLPMRGKDKNLAMRHGAGRQQEGSFQGTSGGSRLINADGDWEGTASHEHR